MPDTVKLTGEEVRTVIEDAEKTEMLSVQEREAFANRLNRVIHIPWVKEDREGVILFKVVSKIDRFLYKVLPNELYSLVKGTHDGISEDEAKKITDRLAGIINKYVDLPFLSEEMEKKLFTAALNIVRLALQKGKSLLEQ